MFLAQIVFSFRSLCLKAIVTDFVLPGMRGEEERGDGQPRSQGFSPPRRRWAIGGEKPWERGWATGFVG